MKRSEVSFPTWNKFTSKYPEPTRLSPTAPGTVMEHPETLAVGLCMSGPIREPRIAGINPVPWLLGALAIILLALAVFGVI